MKEEIIKIIISLILLVFCFFVGFNLKQTLLENQLNIEKISNLNMQNAQKQDFSDGYKDAVIVK